MRAIKRIRYGKKELKRLEEMVSKSLEREAKAIDDLEHFRLEQKKSMDIDDSFEGDSTISIKPMETDQNERNRKTMQNKFGQYPEWMNGRRLKRQKSLAKRLKNKKTKK
ncbi:ribosomal protein L24 [Sarcoptes scabiei]|nr:protein LLP-like protein [Sarcoptes scabiei]UXI21446.1 ribosomal protein L24 [Sarcoptes scabiei]